ncbi:hypothetical protein C8F04DRAFT_1099676 [Mycena alexandri]|uniref:XLF-like N-terminal domain-containing protein n=1 Tax=Mycena alexandri TaxID=1745969 RepID=A0AAD6SVT7_9AGAR|nr:hypothetical protein C8F04DRAFT_1099676 [Mycena alexandri]
MEQFCDEHAKLLLTKEWLVKTHDSTPYLFKCHFSTVDLSCFILVTDTKTVWTEVLNSKQFARRWRACNPDSAVEFTREEDEEEWRTENLELLAKAHSLGGIESSVFDCPQSNYADLALELEYEAFRWKWETCLQGSRVSAEIISRHLVLPLISLNHLAFTSAVSESSETDLEKAVDKVGRSARRSVDTHVKNAMSKPRVATALRRITAMFNFENNLPPIQLSAEKPELQPQVVQVKPRELSPIPSPPFKRRSSPPPDPIIQSATPPHVPKKLPSKEPTPSPKIRSLRTRLLTMILRTRHLLSYAAKGKGRAFSSAQSPAPRPQSLSPEPVPTKPLSRAKVPSSDSDSSPVRPVKKAKPPLSSSDEEDSEAERKRRLAKATSGAGGAKRGGTRQPIKRGGKRF